MAEMHPLFVQQENEDDPPAVEEIGVINVARMIGTRKIPAHRSFRPDEVPDLETLGKMFGSGEYLCIARRLRENDDGAPAGSIYRKVIHIVGAEFGSWKAMLDKAAPAPGAPDASGATAQGPHVNPGAAPPMHLPGMPDPQMMTSPFMMMMWMQMQQSERDAKARQEQIERDRIAADAREHEARRQHELTLEMIRQGSSKPDQSAAIPQMFGQFADALAKAHAPAPVAQGGGGMGGMGQAVSDLKAVVEVAKLVKGNEDIELVKAIGQGLSGLAGLGGILGGGLSGAPAGG